jgi:hypothetical protein
VHCMSEAQNDWHQKCSHTQIDNALAMNQTLAVATLLGKCGVVATGGTASSLSMSI